MSAGEMSASPANPFSPRAALGLVLFGALAFIALLWTIGAGMTSGTINNGGGHAGGKGLTGFAGLADYLDRRGFTVRRSRSAAALKAPGLLVLTPPHGADGKELERIVAERRHIGPTLVVTPKWIAAPVGAEAPGGKRGWVQLGGTATPRWEGFLDYLSAGIGPMRGGAQWVADGAQGTLPVSQAVQSGRGDALVPLVESRRDGRILAGYIADDGMYPDLERLALSGPDHYGEDEERYPLIVVFEPDLLDNYGMASQANALFAERLFAAAAGDSGLPVTFDLTLNGLGRSANLLTLAFTPPFLAATLCLLLAALAVGWRAFLRFGPPRAPVRAIAFGKRALVGNAAGLIRRSGRLHLVAAPYAQAARERLARALALPRQADAAATEAAIDRSLAGRAGVPAAFSTVAERLRTARRPHDILKAAQDLHALERTLQA
jgi:hypothetical protein